MRLWRRPSSKTQRCERCRTKLPTSELSTKAVRRMPTDGAYILDSSVMSVCASCRRTNEEWTEEANAQLRERFRNDCQDWLLGVPLLDPTGQLAAGDTTMSLETAVAECFEAFFYGRRGVRFNAFGAPRHLPATYHHVLTTASSNYTRTYYYKGSIYQTPDQQFFFLWDEDGSSRLD